jgi:hypothetical protein
MVPVVMPRWQRSACLTAEPQRVPFGPSVFGNRLECVFKKPSKARCYCLTQCGGVRPLNKSWVGR